MNVEDVEALNGLNELNVERSPEVFAQVRQAHYRQRRRFDPFDKLLRLCSAQVRAGRLSTGHCRQRRRDAEDEKMWSVIRGRVSARKIQMSVFTQGHRFH